MKNFSVVIIAKNEEENIVNCISSLLKFSNDILVIDSGSTDKTIALAKNIGAKVISVTWQGFGATRNMGATYTQFDWILAIDADETVSDKLIAAIKNIDELNEQIVYGFKRQNYLNGKRILFGEWGKDKVIRLYNKKNAHWDEALVHEVIIGNNISIEYLNGYISHYPVKDDKENRIKTLKYAKLSAVKFYKIGKKATIIKRFFSPLFNFFKMYILLLGFLDGREGYIIAKQSTTYTWLKYKFLYNLYKK
ncbi:MAG: glycosyltransferase family 2 protein [Bacteroidetes bacterium]|nr:glycosyltransferase family 2 protein [Bacteroidota bacterium]